MNAKQHIIFDRLRDEVAELEGALSNNGQSRRADVLNEAVDVLYFLLGICATERLNIDVVLAHAAHKYAMRENGFVHKAGERDYAVVLVRRSDAYLDGLTYEEASAAMDIPRSMASLAWHALSWKT